MLPSLNSILTPTHLAKSILDISAEDNCKRLLSFPIGLAKKTLIPLEQITEIIRVNLDEILSVPETPSSVLGTYNWRGDMLWLIDLEQLIGGTPLFKQVPLPKPHIAIVMLVDNFYFGLVVKAVNEIEIHDLKQILPARPGSFPSQLLPFLSGYLSDGSTIFNPKAVIQYFV